jgi:hypothetical protein
VAENRWAHALQALPVMEAEAESGAEVKAVQQKLAAV